MDIQNNIIFYKMHGSGNDFVIIPPENNFSLDYPTMSLWAKTICTRGFSVGADGLIFLTKKGIKNPLASYKWHFYNSDGSRAEMCGNGSRCAARLACELKIAPPLHVFETDAGPIKAEVSIKEKVVKVQLTPPTNLTLEKEIQIDGKKYKIHHVNTGVPHTVLFFENTRTLDIDHIGKQIRFHKEFEPNGTNVNLVEKIGDNHLYIRTYERGVEGETYACGTGAAACAYIAIKLGLVEMKEINITTSGGENLQVSTDGSDNLYLTGNAVLVYKGELNLKELGL